MHELQETKEERYKVDIKHIAMIGVLVRGCPSLSNGKFTPQQFCAEFGATLSTFPDITIEQAGVLFNQLLLPDQLEKLACNFVWRAAKPD